MYSSHGGTYSALTDLNIGNSKIRILIGPECFFIKLFHSQSCRFSPSFILPDDFLFRGVGNQPFKGEDWSETFQGLSGAWTNMDPSLVS